MRGKSEAAPTNSHELTVLVEGEFHETRSLMNGIGQPVPLGATITERPARIEGATKQDFETALMIVGPTEEQAAQDLHEAMRQARSAGWLFGGLAGGATAHAGNFILQMADHDLDNWQKYASYGGVAVLGGLCVGEWFKTTSKRVKNLRREFAEKRKLRKAIENSIIYDDTIE
jgi:hypothetical protein